MITNLKNYSEGWRQNDASQRIESSWCRKVVDLMSELSSKHLWSLQLALHFLQDQYELKYKAHSFCDYLTKENREMVLQAAMGYPSYYASLFIFTKNRYMI
jgi:hypothetical protein